ncbi:putative Thioredoxin domain-containing protein [Hibiscus syriacus]|uniref:RING-type E3 ubiquitin transferase n=1 Tax=Hibiscus syriacus TaxID=106335 RepID=A0A6A2WAQ4_HIBSY|nr:E3 ubiquitin-protein ligase MBR2-like [Hibiscus syriacus]XP_039055078.1 E3 ubiquitin-protein ligase MBR2-like [Hibiscus syriacus]XP_039055079.1 E3 ubiquitin-protein ligase MBR2-like [Hibiscus syriacus]KAE8654658.1 putative Thioredoxin domain-containing protein [Hibiscus syriacus]
MDGYSSKRAADGLVVPGKGSGIILKGHVNNTEGSGQFCNRIGSSGRLNSWKGTSSGCSEKAKSLRPSYLSSSNGKEIVGSSSRVYSAVINSRKSSTNPQKKLSSQLETDSSETNSVQDEPEVSELISPPGKIQRGLHPKSEDADSREVSVMEVGSSSAASNTRPRRNLIQCSGLGNQDTLAGPSVTLVSRSASQATHANTSNGFRNIRCNSISDVLPSGCSSPASSFSRRKDTVKKRTAGGEGSSSTGGKMLGGSALEGLNNRYSHGVPISDSRRAINWPPNSGGSVASSVRTRRPSSSYVRGRLPNQENGSNLTLNESPVVMQQVPQCDVTVDLSAPVSSETSSTSAISYCRPGRISESLHSIMPSIPSDNGINRRSVNRDSFWRYNMDGIAEVLLTLERIEQDEELTYEQLLVLETSLFLNGLNFYDQHRDMRLDIDNMSYEELLALEERMGNVSTALSEEAMSKCLKKSVYGEMPLENAKVSCEVEKADAKCSICQEEYFVGDEVGRLQCEHSYHVECIQQWLGLKNWCPICKASVEAMQSPCSPHS